MVGILAVTSTGTIRCEVVSDTQVEKHIRAMKVDGKQRVIQEHTFIAGNNHFEMYLKEDTLSLIIRDKQSGALMYSTVDEIDESSNEAWQNFMRSGIVLEYIKGTNVNLYKADMLSSAVKKQVMTSSTGFVATIEHTDIGISYEVHVELTEDGFTVEVPQSSMVESNDEFKIGGFYLYPFLGYTKEGQRDGYMFIPDGSGALIYLEDNNGKFKQPFSKWIYGENAGVDENAVPSMFKGQAIVKSSEYLLAPIFGMVHTDAQIGVLGIVEGGGEYSAKIEAYPNGAVTKYDWITSRFVYRQVYNQPTSKSSGMIVARQKEMNQFDARIRYKFVTGEDATYTGLATAYREHLMANGQLSQLQYDYQTRVDFLGAERENWLLFKKSVPMTTFEDVENIVKELQSMGVTDILSIYKGWQKDGISGGIPVSGLNVEGSLGSGKELVELMKNLEGSGVELYLDQDALRMNAEKKSLIGHSAIKKLNKRVFEEMTYKEVYESYNYLLPSKTAQILSDNKKVFTQKGISNIMLSGISNTLFSHSAKGAVKDRGTTAQAYEEMIGDYKDTFNLLLEQPFSYLWQYSKAIIDMPMEGSNYIFTDEEIPFLAIVLKGMMPMYTTYVNFEANKEENFLKMVEQGVYPSFYITQEDPAKLLHTNSSEVYSSRFDLYKDEIVAYNDALSALHEKVKGANIIAHKKEGDLVTVGYSNGVTVYVNYGRREKKVDDLVIPAGSYKVGDAT